MKAKSTVIMAMAAIVALASVGCNKVELSSNETGRQAGDLVIKATTPATKTVMTSDSEGYALTWTSSDLVKLVSAGTAYESSAISLSSNNTTAEFTFDGAAGISGKYDIYSPSKAVTVSGTGVTLYLEQSQTTSATTPDPDDFLMMGSGETPELNVAFDHLVSYVKLTVKGLLPNEAVNSINVQAYGYAMAGDITFDESGAPVYSGHINDANNIYLSAWQIGKADESGVLTAWFATKPFTLAAGKTFKVAVKQKDPNDNTKEVEIYNFTLTAAKDVAFDAGKVVSLPVSIPGEKYTVSFDTNGGSAIASVEVKDGACVEEPADPELQLAEGLYLGSPDELGEFQGWYSDSGLTEAYDFSTPVTSDLTLYAKWGGSPEKLDLSAWESIANYTVVHGALKYVNSQTLSEETHYTLVLTSDKQFWGGADGLNKENAVLHIIGQGAERKIFANSKWFSILTVSGSGTIVLEENLLLYNLTIDKNSVINIYGAGTVIMNEGCRLSGSRGATESTGIVVRMDNGGCKFIMNGGEICDNQSESNVNQSVIYINGGRFEMHGGVISDNAISTTGADTYISGAILFNGWAYFTNETSQRSFVKDGGEIKNNTATRNLAEEVEITGKRGQQFLIIGGAEKKIDANVSASQNLDASSCWSYPWVSAVAE